VRNNLLEPLSLTSRVHLSAGILVIEHAQARYFYILYDSKFKVTLGTECLFYQCVLKQHYLNLSIDYGFAIFVQVIFFFLLLLLDIFIYYEALIWINIKS
jgi:hypothetical protein